MATKKPPVKPVYCLHDGVKIEKKTYESRKRYSNRKFCSTKCAKAYMKEHGIGWFNPGAQTINRKKKRAMRGDDTMDWIQKQELKRMEREYPELKNF